MGLASDGAVGLLPGRGKGGGSAPAALYKEIEFKLAHAAASMQRQEE